MPTGDYTFDGINKLVHMNVTASSDLNGPVQMKDIYSRWKQWATSGSNSGFFQAIRTVGGDPISEVQSLGITYFMINGWKLQPTSSNHTLEVDGNVYGEEISGSSTIVVDPIEPASGSFNVLTRINVSNLIDLIIPTVDVSGTSPTASLDPTILAKIDELWKIHGLDSGSAVYVDESSRMVGHISQSIVQGVNNTIISRDP